MLCKVTRKKSTPVSEGTKIKKNKEVLQVTTWLRFLEKNHDLPGLLEEEIVRPGKSRCTVNQG